MKLTIVIPVYNECQFIAKVLERVQKASLDGVKTEIIIVDDFSSDGTRKFLQNIVTSRASSNPKDSTFFKSEEEIKILFQDRNLGKGAAVRRGFKEASGEFLVVQDADLEYDPEEYPKLLDPLLKGVADVAYGSRFLGSQQRSFCFWHYLANRFLTMLSNLFTNPNLTDMETCYKMFRRDVLDGIEIKENRFGFEPEITAKVAKRGYRIYEVPISYHGRIYGEGKKVGWIDGLRAIWCIVRYNLFG